MAYAKKILLNLGVLRFSFFSPFLLFFFFFFFREMSPARWRHPGGCPPAGPASNVVSGKVEKIRENKEHLVPGPFT